MFDEIFKRWVNTGQLLNSDIIPLFLEWNQTFGNGKATTKDVQILTQFLQVDYNSLLSFILKMVGIKKGYQWGEIYDKDGRFMGRFWNCNEENLYT